jgi:cytochrome c oxidase subunit II
MKFPGKPAAAIVSCAVLLASLMRAGSPPDPQRIQILASRFSFQPREITLRKGVRVTIAVHALDTTHGLVIEDLRVLTEIPRGQTRLVKLVPSSTGTFEGRCAHFCGRGHPGMTFTVHVVE